MLGSDPIIETYENEAYSDVLTAELDSVSSWSVALSDGTWLSLEEHIFDTPDGLNLTVEFQVNHLNTVDSDAPSPDLFPMKTIEFLDSPVDEGGTEDSVKNLTEMLDAEESEVLLRFEEDNKDLVSDTLEVTATGTKAGSSATDSGSFEIIIYAQYGHGNKQLKELLSRRGYPNV